MDPGPAIGGADPGSEQVPLAPVLLLLPVLKGSSSVQDGVVVDELYVTWLQVIVHSEVIPGCCCLQ